MKKVNYLILFLIISVTLSSQAYVFSKNKVNYTIKKWLYTKTEHFDIYYYQGGEDIASFAVMVAESSMVKLEKAFKHKLKNRVPIIIYNSHKDFEETNVTMELLSEFVGGFTESLKNRVVVPFDGSYADFRHVINHELVHSVQFDMLFGKGGAGMIVSSVIYDIPLWFIEGTAEYFSREWDRETDMYMRDAVVNDGFVDLTTLGYYGGYIVYKEGQAVIKYIVDTYGEDKIQKIYRDIQKNRSLNVAIKNVLGIEIKRLDRDFKFYLKKRYAALYNTKDVSFERSKTLLGDFMKLSPYNVCPSLSPDGNYVAFISERHGFFDIYILETGNPEKKIKIIPRTLTRHYESFHLKQGNLTWSPDGEWLLLSVRNKNLERIIAYDIKKRKQVFKKDFKADGLFSPATNSIKDKIVFAVMRQGRTDIAIYDINRKEEIIITNDIYDDINPRFLNDSTIIFSSTRPFGEDVWDYQQYSLFSYNINTGNMKRISDKDAGSIINFDILGDSIIIFEGNITDISNIYFLNMKNDSVKQITDVITGVFDPSISSDGNILTVRYMEEMKMDIRMITNPLKNSKNIDKKIELDDYAKIFFPYIYNVVQGENPPFRVSFDWLAGAFSYTPGYGLIGLLDVAVSDIMGNNRLYISMQKLSTTGNGYATVQYWNLRNRINYAIMFLNVQNEYFVDYAVSQVHVYNGLGALASMPINRYNRFDLEIDIYNYEVYGIVYDYYFGTKEKYPLYSRLGSSIILSFVHDNAIWGYYGPVNGDAFRMDIGAAFYMTSAVPNNNFDFIVPEFRHIYVNSDIRKYIVLTSRSQIALHLAGISYLGPEYFADYLGGTGTVRGYSYGEYFASNVYYSNIELRFPLIDQIKFPMPGFFFGNIRGVLFTDFGIAKDDIMDTRLITDQFVLDDLKMGFGAGIRMDIWLAILKVDVAKHTDMRTVSPDYYWHVDFGAEF